MKKIVLLLTPLLVFSKAVKVDEILTDTNKFKLETSISYANINKKQNVIAQLTYQTAGGDFVQVPTYLGSSATNQDYINYGFNLKYGISKKLEIFTNINLFTSDTHISNSEFKSKSAKYKHFYSILKNQYSLTQSLDQFIQQAPDKIFNKV